jgi:glycosyltransferase involved in cell wall biosynthesis
MVQFALPYGPSIRDAARHLGLPYVVQLRGDDVWVWPHRNEESMRSFRETVRDAHLVTGVCRALLDEAERLVGTPLASTAVVPNGIDLERFRPPVDQTERHRLRAKLDLRDDDLVICCVADTIVRKGWLDLLDALGPLHGTSRTVLLGAAPGEVAEFDLLAEARRRAPHVHTRLERGLPAEEIADRYRAADVFCLPSHWEGLANALLEAMASGLPSVTTAVSGHPEVVTDGVDGWLVDAQRVDVLRDRLREVLANPELRAAVGAAARARAEGVGDSSRAGARLAALLDGTRAGTLHSGLLTTDPYARPLVLR